VAKFIPLAAHVTATNSVHNKVSITVIVPVRNEQEHIAHILEQLLEQDHKGLDIEILVADGRSTDNTRDIVTTCAENNPEIQLIDNPHKLSSSARNIAIRESHGDYLVVIDGHCEIPSRTYFIDLVDAFNRSNADCLGRPQPLDVNDATLLQRAIALARSSRLGHHPDSFIYSDQEVDCPAASVAVAYRSSVFDTVGLFDETFDACEDYELNHRIDQAGLRCRLVPKLTVKYQPRPSISGLFLQLFRYGRGRVRLFRKHPESFSLGSFIPAAFVAGVVCGPIVCWAMPLLWPAYLSIVTIYLLAIIGESTRLAWQAGNIYTLLWLPVVFAAIHIGSGSGVLLEISHFFRLK
jgi:succinoglycan biosynthesis protein ExoA